MIGVGATLLVALAAKSYPNHSQAVTVFERELVADEEIARSVSVAAEFLHAVTDPRRLSPALEMSEAIRWLRDWSTGVAPTWLKPDGEIIERWLKWMIDLQLGRKRCAAC